MLYAGGAGLGPPSLFSSWIWSGSPEVEKWGFLAFPWSLFLSWVSGGGPQTENVRERLPWLPSDLSVKIGILKGLFQNNFPRYFPDAQRIFTD